MAREFVACDRGQLLLMPPSLVEWLPEDHLVWTILGAVEQMDLEPAHGGYRLGGAGRPPHDPADDGGVVLYAYARGNRSSRGIERACWEDVAFKVITGCGRRIIDDRGVPPPSRARHRGALRRVLGLCREAGLVSVGVITIDGTKIKADASMDQDRITETGQADPA